MRLAAYHVPGDQHHAVGRQQDRLSSSALAASSRGCGRLPAPAAGIAPECARPSSPPADSPFPALTILAMERKEHRNVAAQRNIDANGLLAAFARQNDRPAACATAAHSCGRCCLRASDSRADDQRPAPRSDAREISSAAAFQSFGYHVEQKLREQRRTRKVGSGDHALRQLPVWIILAGRTPHLVGKRRPGLRLDSDGTISIRT